MKIDYTSVRELRPHPNNARTHSKKQIRQIGKSIAQFGFCLTRGVSMNRGLIKILTTPTPNDFVRLTVGLLACADRKTQKVRQGHLAKSFCGSSPTLLVRRPTIRHGELGC
jgi:hypothetical protein